jgi:hypothetical protein
VSFILYIFRTLEYFVAIESQIPCRCPGTSVLSISGIPDDVAACNTMIVELRGRIENLTERSLRITQGLTSKGISTGALSFQIISSLEVDCSSESDVVSAKNAFNSALSEFVSKSHWQAESCVQFHDTIAGILSKLPEHKYTMDECVAECHAQISLAADNYVLHSLKGATSESSNATSTDLLALHESRICGVQCQVQQSGLELKIFLVDCNNVTFSTTVTSDHPFVRDYLDRDPSLLTPFVQGFTGSGGVSQIDVTFANDIWTISVVRPLKLTFNLSMERSPHALQPPAKLSAKDVRNIIKSLISDKTLCFAAGTVYPSEKLYESLYSLLVHPQPRRMAVSNLDTSASDGDFKALEEVTILRWQLFQHVAAFHSSDGAQIDPRPALDLAMSYSLIRKVPSRVDSEIRFKSAARHMSLPAPSVPDSALNASTLVAALPFPFQVSVAAVLTHLLFIRIISDFEIDSGAIVTSGRGRLLLQRSSLFCFLDYVASDALPPPPDKFSSFGSFISKETYPCIMRVHSNDLSMFSYVLETLRLAILNGPLPYIFHPFCLKVSDAPASSTWIRQCIENPFFGTSVKQWAEFNSVGDRLMNLHAQRCSFYVSTLPHDTSRRFVAGLKNCMSDKFLCNVWDSQNSTSHSATALAEARHFIIALTPEYLASGACMTELLHILDLVSPATDDPRPAVAAHARAISANPALRKTISLLLLHPAMAAPRFSSISQVCAIHQPRCTR